MKKLLFTVYTLALILIAAGCNSSDKEENASSKAPTPTKSITDTAEKDTVKDTVPTTGNIPFHVKKYGEKKGDNVLDMEYPVSGNPELLGSVRNWMNEQLTDTYRGNLDDAEAFFRHYVAQMGEDPEFYDEGVYTYDDFRVGYVNDCIVTYDYTSYIYEGGEHEDGGTYGITFLQSDGSIFNRDCISSYKALHPYIIKGLKKYFKVSSDEDLQSKLLTSNSLDRLSPPGRDPWLEENGVVFSYVPYEIAPFEAGSPQFTIPYSEIEQFLTPQGKRFIQGKGKREDFRDNPADKPLEDKNAKDKHVKDKHSNENMEQEVLPETPAKTETAPKKEEEKKPVTVPANEVSPTELEAVHE